MAVQVFIGQSPLCQMIVRFIWPAYGEFHLSFAVKLKLTAFKYLAISGHFLPYICGEESHRL